jgi:hypothetical protein
MFQQKLSNLTKLVSENTRVFLLTRFAGRIVMLERRCAILLGDHGTILSSAGDRKN